MAAGPTVSGPLFFKAAFACPAEDEFAPKSGKPDVGGRAKQRPGPSILKSGRLPRAAAKMPHPKFVRMASENFNPTITFDAVAVDEKEDYWETTADILERAWRPPWKRFAYMYRPTPGYLRDDGTHTHTERPGNIFRDGERGVDHSPTYHPFYSTLSRVAARSRALSLASVVRTEISPRPPGSCEDLRPAVGIAGGGGWIYTGDWEDDLEDRPPARTLTAFHPSEFALIDESDPDYDPDDYVHIEVPALQPWWREPDVSEYWGNACPTSSSRRRKRMAKRAREQQRLLDMSPAAWDKRLSAPQTSEISAPPTSVQDILKELNFDPDEPLDLWVSSPSKGAADLAKKGQSGQPDGPDGEANAQPAKAAGKANVDLWLVDTGCGSDLIEKSEIRNLKPFVAHAAKTITFHTANGPTTATEIVRLFVEEFGEEIKPYILDSTPAVVSVGLRCMKKGYTFIWPARSLPYFILPNGNLVYLEVIGDIPYLRPGARECRPRAPTGGICFACGCVRQRSHCPACDPLAAESGEPDAVPGEAASGVDPVPPPPAPDYPDPADMDDVAEAEANLPERVRRDLKAEAHSLHHLLRHKPSNPYCEACRRGRMRKKARYKGSFVNTAAYWGHHLTGDHITSIKDNMLGVTGDRNAFVVKDLYSQLKHLYPTKTKDAAETTASIRHFVGDRTVSKLYSDNSGEIEKALKECKIMSHTSLPGEPRNNAVAERTNGDILEGARSALIRAGLPSSYWPYAAEHYCMMENVHFTQDKESPWFKTHGVEFHGHCIPFGAKGPLSAD